MEDKKLEGLLSAAGNKLLEPADSVDDLLTLLEKVEDLLIRVDQSPSESMKIALSPCVKGLVAKDLLTHSDPDVNAAVAVCISEITRITAPEAPYEDHLMKEIFQLIVSTFERLWDSGSRSYYKRISILETVAKVRSCVVMLDLECDSLILEMFQHFIKTIRDNQPDNVFGSMETIMTLVLEESEDIPFELLSPILAIVKRSNEEGHPTIVRKLVERVLQNCGAKLKPYILQSLENLNHSIADYSNVVTRICQETSGANERNDTNACAEHSIRGSKLEGLTSDEATQLHKKIASEAASLGEAHTPAVNSSKSVMSNGVKEAAIGDAVVASSVSKKPDDASNSNRRERRVVIKLSEKSAKVSQAEPENLDTSKLVIPESNSENKKEQTSKKRGRKFSALKKAVEPKLSEQGPTDVEKQCNEVHDSGKSKRNETDTSHQMDVSIAPAPPEKESENAVQPSSPRKLESDSVNVHSRSKDGSIVRKGGRSRKKSYIACQATPLVEVAGTKILEETTDAEVKADKKAGKKVDASKGHEKRQKGEKNNLGNDGENSTIDEKESIVLKSEAKLTKDKGLSGGNSGIKRKHTLGKEKTTGSVEYGEKLVGSRLKVWWPIDKAFYEGVIESFDPIKKKHKVLYCDGEVEILALSKERWELIKSNSNEEAGSDGADDSAPKHQKQKLNSSSSTKERKVEAAPMRDDGSFRKFKASAKKTATATEDHAEVDGCKTIDKADAKKAGKLKDDDVKKSAKKVEPETPKHKSRSKQDKLKVIAKGGGESSKTDGKLKSNETGKLKSKPSKSKEKETAKEKSPELLVEIAKRKSSESSKGKQSEGKSAKKRRKEVS